MLHLDKVPILSLSMNFTSHLFDPQMKEEAKLIAISPFSGNIMIEKNMGNSFCTRNYNLLYYTMVSIQIKGVL